MRTILVIPAYNEAENLERVVGELVRDYPTYDYVIVNDDYYNEMDSLILADVDDLAHKFEEYRVCLETILDSGIVEGKTHDALRAFYDCVVKYRNNLCNDDSYGQMLDVELQKFLSDVDNDDKAMY